VSVTGRVASVLAVTVFVGCGIPLDDAPRAQATTSAPVEQSTPTTPSGGSAAFVYLTVEDHIVPVESPVGDGSPEARLQALLGAKPVTPTASQIPTGTRLRGVQRNSSVVTVDLTDEFDNLQGTARRMAAAQIVFTLTELPGIEDVLFRVEGRATQVDSPLVGDTDRVRACDYLELLPTTEQAVADQLDAEAMEHADERRVALRRCPNAPSDTSRD